VINLPVFANRQFIAIAIALFVILIFLFNFGFYAFYFFTNWQQSVEEKAQLQVHAADLEREKSLLQYHQLKNQVNPHFLFNTLTSLDGLIQTDPELASDFVRHLSKVYRYVLQHKENEVVSIAEELEFIDHYVNLLHIRYCEGLRVQIDITHEAKEKGIVMVTLQMLIDNAIKHNIVQPEKPLLLHVYNDSNALVVENNKQLRKQIETSNGQGLQQLKQLYQFLSGTEPVVTETADSFTIRIPFL
jgi:LytS/YehU family sensor histidine kinase